jgi:hypothetical protein
VETVDFTGFNIKEYQTFAAAIVALIAAIIAFAGVQLNAILSYLSAQNAAKKQIIWQREQADIAAHNRRTAVVTWLYLRVVDARNRMGNIYTAFVAFDNIWAMVKGKPASEIRDDHYFQLLVERISKIEPVLKNSDIKSVELDFLVGLDHRDQELFFSAFSEISAFDDYVREIQSGLSAFLNNPIEDKEHIEFLRGHEIKNIKDSLDMYQKGLEKSVAESYSALRAISKQRAEHQT